MRKHFVPPPISTPPGQTYNYYTSFLSLVVTTGPPSFPPYFHPFTSLDVIHEFTLIHTLWLSCTWYSVVLGGPCSRVPSFSKTITTGLHTHPKLIGHRNELNCNDRVGIGCHQNNNGRNDKNWVHVELTWRLHGVLNICVFVVYSQIFN